MVAEVVALIWRVGHTHPPLLELPKCHGGGPSRDQTGPASLGMSCSDEPLGLRCGASRGRLLWRAATTTVAARQKKTRRQEVAIGVEDERCTARKLTPLDPWPWRE